MKMTSEKKASQPLVGGRVGNTLVVNLVASSYLGNARKITVDRIMPVAPRVTMRVSFLTCSRVTLSNLLMGTEKQGKLEIERWKDLAIDR